MRKLKLLATAAALSTLAMTAFADGHAGHSHDWTLDAASSNVSFGSIKNDYTGESHHFKDISGTVSEDGIVTLSLSLTSVETMIDIRNERLQEYVFDNGPKATVTAEVDMEALTALAIGESTLVDASGTLDLVGVETDLDTSLFVMRLSEDKVLVTTNGMIMLSTEDAELDEGLDTLQKLAGLDSITRVSPVTLRLIFDLES